MMLRVGRQSEGREHFGSSYFRGFPKRTASKRNENEIKLSTLVVKQTNQVH